MAQVKRQGTNGEREPQSVTAPLTAPLTVVLPLPDPLLTPNVRMHWAEKARHVKAQRREAQWCVYDVTFMQWKHEMAGPVRIDVEVRPRPRMKRLDDDNLWAALKAYRDGVADALGIDDRHFISGSLTWAKERTGEVVVTLTQVG